MKVASITLDEVVQIRVALNNAELTLRRILKQENYNYLKPFYEGELEATLQAKAALDSAIKRDM